MLTIPVSLDRVGSPVGLLTIPRFSLSANSSFTAFRTLARQAPEFEAIPIFGELLVGSSVGDSATWVAGFGYHVFNGVGFAMFYSMLMGRKGVLAGVGWAFLLEVVTLFVYPGWLDIKARGEFTAVSLAGHIGYGIALGYLAKRMLRGES